MTSGSSRPLVGILFFDEMEVLDFAGPYEVFACSARADGTKLFEVLTLGDDSGVTCAGGLVVKPDALIAQAPKLDILVVPGGRGARQGSNREDLVKFITEQANQGAVVASVCTGSFLLAHTGLLEGKSATTHPYYLDDFAKAFPQVQVTRSKLVDQNEVLTSGGVASGVDLALHLLERWHGADERRREAARLDGPWF